MVFGRLVEGLPLLREIEAVGSKAGAPSTEVLLVDCGQLEVRGHMCAVATGSV